MLKGYRTVIFNVVMGGISLVRALAPDAELPNEETVGVVLDNADVFITGAWLAGNLVLRAITNSALFQKR